MTTIAEFAIERGVSEKTVRRRIADLKNSVGQVRDKLADKSDKLSDSDLIVKIKNVTYVTEKAEQILSTLLPNIKAVSDGVGQNRDKVMDKSDKVTDSVRQTANEINGEILFLREQVKSLNDELKAEREHNRTMSKQNIQITDRLAQITENQQKLLGMEQVKNTPAALMSAANVKQKEKHKWFSFFKKR